MIIKNRDQMIKKLLYQSCNRGCKETDLIIGLFARENLEKMNDNDLLTFEKILQQNDADLYDWYVGKKPIPKEISSSIMTKIMKFVPAHK
ncbi:MAG: succinate dehydrogenase assembly factor 2 [Rickettsiales bacterium]|nr:succinate dehydrogenase assembly factor 2 [Rickettsiales bacterium]